MTSRTGLMPVAVHKPADRRVSAAAHAKDVRKPTVRLSASKTVPVKKLLNAPTAGGVHSQRTEQEPHLLASKKARYSVTSRYLTSIKTKDVKPHHTSDTSKDLKRKSHPQITSTQKPQHATPGRKSLVSVKRTPRSILKKEHYENSAFKVNVGMANEPATDSRHVKFKTKATEQASLRAKLNSWLEAKGKTPSRCRHLMCFDAEMSAKKKSGKLVDRTITQNLLSHQEKALHNEEVKKRLFPTVAETKEKENVGQTEAEKMVTDSPVKDYPHKPAEDSQATQSPIPDVSSSNSNITGEAILSNLKTMLDECLTLFHAGCPMNNILPWLKEMETHIPSAKTFAPYYICKAKVVEEVPSMVLDVYCEAVKNNAQPCDLLASEMKAAMSQLLMSTSQLNTSTEMTMHTLSPPSAILTSHENLQSLNSDPHTPAYDSNHSTPVRDSDSAHKAQTTQGSIVKYSITSTTPLLRHTPENVQLAVVTPVRRSTRLSNRQSTPGQVLRREVNSVSDLGSEERRSMLFRKNQALCAEEEN